MRNIDKNEWSKVIEDTLRLFGYEGKVTIEDGESPDEWLIRHPSFDYPFVGIQSKVDDMFTVVTMDHRYKDLYGQDRKHKEGIVFFAPSMTPIYYSIFNEPEYQRVMINDFLKRKKGDIVYSNSCVSGSYRQHTLVKPIFESEVFDILDIINTLRYGA